MHLIVIIAFAALLWFNSDKPMNKLGLGPWGSALIVLGGILALVAAALWTTRRTLATLEKNPADPNDAQCDHHHYSMILQLVMAGLFVANLILTDWPGSVRRVLGDGLTLGLVDLVVLLPFIVTMILVWIVQYPVDRAIRELALNPRLEQGQAIHAVWRLAEYLSFNVRYHLLTIAAPMILIIVGDDVIDHYRAEIRQAAGGLIWVSEALMGILVCIVFVLAPVMLRLIWNTQPLPSGELRRNLERIGRKTNLKYRDILLWRSRGMIVNAAVMGILPQVRYVLISDGLLESMSDRQIEAVFGHEAGHISCWHIPYFIVFATLTMLIAGGLIEVLRWVATHQAFQWLTFDVIQIIVGLFVVGLWGVAFGWLSHRFEHQADICGAESITPEGTACTEPCRVHAHENQAARSGLCATAAADFALALRRVAALNGIPLDERGWRHPSIQDRIAFLTGISEDGALQHKFASSVALVKVLLILGTLLGLVISAWLYWRLLLPPALQR